jgi:hypothetical protein
MPKPIKVVLLIFFILNLFFSLFLVFKYYQLKKNKLSNNAEEPSPFEKLNLSPISFKEKYLMDYDFLATFDQVESGWIRVVYEDVNAEGMFYQMNYQFTDKVPLVCSPTITWGVPTFRLAQYGDYNDFPELIAKGMSIPLEKRLEILKKYEKGRAINLGFRFGKDGDPDELLYVELFLEDPTICEK